MKWRIWLSAWGVYLAWVVSLMATAGSLAWSEIFHWTPCSLCWLQRSFMYPLTLILGIASFRNDRQVGIYALPLAIIGGSIALYHYALQLFPNSRLSFCGAALSCAVDPWHAYGFLTTPLLSFLAFFLIAACLMLGREQKAGASDSVTTNV